MRDWDGGTPAPGEPDAGPVRRRAFWKAPAVSGCRNRSSGRVLEGMLRIWSGLLPGFGNSSRVQDQFSSFAPKLRGKTGIFGNLRGRLRTRPGRVDHVADGLTPPGARRGLAWPFRPPRQRCRRPSGYPPAPAASATAQCPGPPAARTDRPLGPEPGCLHPRRGRRTGRCRWRQRAPARPPREPVPQPPPPAGRAADADVMPCVPCASASGRERP